MNEATRALCTQVGSAAHNKFGDDCRSCQKIHTVLTSERQAVWEEAAQIVEGSGQISDGDSAVDMAIRCGATKVIAQAIRARANSSRGASAHAAEQTTALRIRVRQLVDDKIDALTRAGKSEGDVYDLGECLDALLAALEGQETEHWCQHGTVCARIEGQP